MSRLLHHLTARKKPRKPQRSVSGSRDLLVGRSLMSLFRQMWLYQRQNVTGGELSLPSEERLAIY